MSGMKYRRKTAVVEAFQLTRARWAAGELPAWVGNVRYADPLDPDQGVIITALDDTELVPWGYWVIRTEEGQLRVSRPDVFPAAYEEVR